MNDTVINTEKLTRLEIINHAGANERINIGRCFGAHKDLGDFKSLTFLIQDRGRTLKIFLDK